MSSRFLMMCATATLLAARGAGAAGAGLRIVDNPALGNFVDITRDGTRVTLADDGEAALGTFGGSFVLAPGLRVIGQNGGLAFGSLTVTDLAAANQMIPSSGAFAGGQCLLPFWDDIDDKDGDAFVLDAFGTFIVQWNWHDFDGAGSTLRFQIQVFPNFEPTGVYAQYLYELEGAAVTAGENATIGYQDGGQGFGDIQFSFNQAGAVVDGTVLTLLIPSCAADSNGDDAVDLTDLLNVILDWGGNGAAHGGDVDSDGDVDIGDLIAVLQAWGGC